MKVLLTSGITLLTVCVLTAQVMIPKKVVKWDAYALTNRSLSVALELRNAPKISWEFGFGLTQHTPGASDIFTDKITTAEYRVLETNESGWNFIPPNSTAEFIGDGRPLPQAAKRFQANYSADFRLGCMVSFLSRNKRWRLLMMPSLQSSYVQYRESAADFVTVKNRRSISWIESIPSAGHPDAVQLVTQYTTDYQQAQRSDARGTFLGGVAYEMGVSRYFSKKIMGEVRYRIGQNFAGLDGKENLPPLLQRGFSTFSVHVGMILDKPEGEKKKPTKAQKKKAKKKKVSKKKKSRLRH